MDPATIEGGIAFFVPLLIALLKQVKFPAAYNAIIAMVVYIVFGVVAVVISGQPIDANDLVPTIVLFTTVGTTAYYAFWRNVGERTLEAKTSFVG